MTATELKRELSKLSGIDFFNPKYREVFKKAFPEEKQTEEKPDDGKEETTEAAEVQKEPAIEEQKTDGVKDEKQAEVKAEAEEQAEDGVKLKEPDHTEAPEQSEEQAEDGREEAPEATKKTEDPKEEKTADLLLDAKIENELLRGGVRDEKLGAAMRLAKSEVKSLEELWKVKEILNDFPEWVCGFHTKGFGMDVDNSSDNLTEEEKRLKQMGIDPRN